MDTIGYISEDVIACLNETIQGVGNVAYLINIQDIDKDTTVVQNLAIGTLYLNPGGVVHECTVPENGIDANAKLYQAEYKDMFDHNMIIRLFVNDTDNRLRMMEMLRGRFAVKYLTWTDGGEVWQIAGYQWGLKVMNIEANWIDPETMGGWIVELGCDDLIKEKDIPYIVGDIAESPLPISIEVVQVQVVDPVVIEGGLIIHLPTAVIDPISIIITDEDDISSYYPLILLDKYNVKAEIGEGLPKGTYKVSVIHVEGSVPVSGGMNYISGTFADTDLVAGYLTITASVSMDRPLNFYMKNVQGSVQRFPLLRLGATQVKINLGEIRPGNYSYYVTYIDD